MELVPNYVDYSSVNSLAAVLRWCDTAGLWFLQQLVDGIVRENLQVSLMQAAVMRVIKVELQVRGAVWESMFSAFACSGGCGSGSSVIVAPSLSRLGTTSYTIQNQVSAATGLLLAKVETVMVQLDPSLSRPVPLPHPQTLRNLLRPAPSLSVLSVGEPPDDSFQWQVQVRPSDCDLLGHMNNASFAVLFEDARRAASSGNCLDLSQASIEYVGQAMAFEMLRITVWWDSQVLAFGLRMSSQKGVLARAVLVPFQDSRM